MGLKCFLNVSQPNVGEFGERRKRQWGKRLEQLRDLTPHLHPKPLASGIWVSSLIYLTFPLFLIDVKHNHSHLISNT